MFKELRKKQGLTTEFTSKKLDISISTLYKIEQYQHLPSMSILLKMKNLYKCSYEEIMKSYEFARGVYDDRKNKKHNK